MHQTLLYSIPHEKRVMEHGGNCGNVQKRATKSDTSGPGHCLVCAACPTASCATRRRSLHRVLRLRCAGPWPALDRAVAQPGPNASDDSDAPGSRPLAQARAFGLARPGPGDSVDSERAGAASDLQVTSQTKTFLDNQLSIRHTPMPSGPGPIGPGGGKGLCH